MDVPRLELCGLVVEEEGGKKERQQVGDRVRTPDAGQRRQTEIWENPRQNQDGGNHKKDLAGQTQKNGEARLSGSLKIHGNDDLEPHEDAHREGNSQRRGGHGDKFRGHFIGNERYGLDGKQQDE